MSFDQKVKHYTNYLQHGNGYPVFKGYPLGRRQKGRGIVQFGIKIFKYLLPFFSKAKAAIPILKKITPKIANKTLKKIVPKLAKKALPIIAKKIIKNTKKNKLKNKKVITNLPQGKPNPFQNKPKTSISQTGKNLFFKKSKSKTKKTKKKPKKPKKTKKTKKTKKNKKIKKLKTKKIKNIYDKIL